jgi:hypothetical protein
MIANSEAEIFSRVIEPENARFAPDVARLILRWEFGDADRHRMQQLLEKAKQGTLTHAEKAQAEAYEKVGHLLSTLKAKARMSLKTARSGS